MTVVSDGLLSARNTRMLYAESGNCLLETVVHVRVYGILILWP